ncbi:calcium-binding and coiled-coil domain-containing protein 2 isoform X1 [Phlebotomus papatasi]|uniref:calcium-binding and coiled-coil domain-containing protein 2 isoform X1 n=2 Tax=Phlebotomus papatasi TaxID=29031 RepID=UPI002484487E|nr:calcium-binding and coiled-coil domain-containing protein 2 isoform X1 [Phlebotomus papatasi]
MNSDKYEEEIFRLNQKIKELFGTAEKVTRENNALFKENKLLNTECVNLRRENMENSTINLQLRLDLEAVTEQRDDLYEANQKLKVGLNRLSERSRTQAETITKMEHMIKSQTAIIKGQAAELKEFKSRPEIIRGLADLPASIAPNRQSDPVLLEQLREEVHSLEEKLDEAYDVIEGLEFELESLDFLEAEHERMEAEIEALKREIRHQKDQNQPDEGDGAAKPCPSQDPEKKHRREMLHKKLEGLHQKQHKRDE